MKKTDKILIPFLQTRPTTCGVSCVMMARNYFLDTPLSTVEEGRLRKKLKLGGFDIIPAISLALFMKEEGLVVKVRHDEPRKFWKFIGENFSEEFVIRMQDRHAMAARHGVKAETGAISPEEILGELKFEKLVILGTETAEGIKHAILLYGIEPDGKVQFVDPLVGAQVQHIDSLLERARMDVGTWYISIGEKPTL